MTEGRAVEPGSGEEVFDESGLVLHPPEPVLTRADSWRGSLGGCVLWPPEAAEAEDRLRQALEIFQRIGAAEVPDLAAELKAITDERSTAQ